MLNFEINYTGSRKVEEMLRGLGEAFGPQVRDQILKKIAVEYLKETEKRFDAQSDPDRKKWKPLQNSTIRLKQLKGSLMGPTHIGVWTGRLASSIKYRLSGDSVYIGSDVPYAPWFHYGTRKGWGPVPSRRFLGRNTRIDQKALNVLENEIRKRLGMGLTGFGA